MFVNDHHGRDRGMGMDDTTTVSTLTFPFTSDDQESSSDDLGTSEMVHHPSLSARINDSLYGREAELALLKRTWERVSSDSVSPSEVVWVSGISGVGKSALVTSLRRHVESKKNKPSSIYVSSKFDQISFATRREPFYAMVAALSDICEIVSADDESREAIGSEVKEKLGLDLGLFAQFVPTLPQLVSGDQQNFLGIDDHDIGLESLTRIKRACKAFMSVVSSHRPLFLVLDDIQWVDNETRALLRSLIYDPESTSICFVFCAREDDLVTKPVANALGLPLTNAGGNQDIGGTSDTDDGSDEPIPLKVTEIHLNDLSSGELSKMICGWLDCEETAQTTSELNTIVYEKTRGNPFFVIQFLELLIVEKLLRYSREDERWEWEIQDRMARLYVSDDVLKSIDTRVYALDALTRSALMVAAHLGFQFRVDILKVALLSLHRKVGSSMLEDRFEEVIETGVKASMLLRTNNGTQLCFMHDRVRQCLYEMIPEGETKERLYLEIGRQLKTMTTREPQLTFLVVDKFNSGKNLISDRDEKLSLVKLNQEAAELATKKSSHASASHYLRNATSLLDAETTWKENYDLCLRVWSSFALSLYHAGSHRECDEAVGAVLENAKDTLDKQQAYEAWLQSLIVRGKSDEALRIGISVVAELGAPMRVKESKLSLLIRLIRHSYRLNKMTDEQLLNLPKMEDKNKIAAYEIQRAFAAAMFTTNDPSMVLVCNLYLIEGLLNYGRSIASPRGFAQFAMLEAAVFKNFKRSHRLAMLAKEMVKACDGSESESYVDMANGTFTLPWSQEWHSILEILHNGFETAMKHGAMYEAATCIGSLNCPLLMYTRTLKECREKLQSGLRVQMQLQGRVGIHTEWTKPFLQQTLNLMGRGERALVLDGEAMQEADFLSSCQLITLFSFHLRKLELGCFFRSLYQASKYAELLEKKDYGDGHELLCPLVVHKNFFCALTYVDLARHEQLRRRRYIRKGRKLLKWLEKIVRKGCVSAAPYRKVVSVEIAAATGSLSIESLQVEFDKAIEAALQHGFLGIAALTCERAYQAVSVLPGTEGASQSYWRRALDLYTRWEALGKVDDMNLRVENGEPVEQPEYPPEEVGIRQH